MPEEAQTPEETQDTSTQTEAPQEETASESEVNWEQRYNDLRPEFDRKSQQLSQNEQLIQNLRNPEIGPVLLEEIAPYLWEEDQEGDGDEEGDHPGFVTRQEYDQDRQREQAQTMWAGIETHVDELAGKANLELTQRQRNWLAREIYETPGVNQTKGEEIFKEFQGELEQLRDKSIEGYRESKQAAQAPGGSAAVKTEDLDDPRARAEYINRAMQDLGT